MGKDYKQCTSGGCCFRGFCIVTLMSGNACLYCGSERPLNFSRLHLRIFYFSAQVKSPCHIKAGESVTVTVYGNDGKYKVAFSCPTG